MAETTGQGENGLPQPSEPVSAALEAKYRNEMLRHCGEFFQTIAPMAEVLRGNSSDLDAFWRAVPTAMSHVAAVSKILWPISGSAKARGRYLRRALEVPPEWVIRDRSVRDSLEHFDERLEKWASRSPFKNMVSEYIGPRDKVNFGADEEWARWYDPTTHTLHVFESSIDFQEVTREMSELQRTLVRQYQEGGGQPRFGHP